MRKGLNKQSRRSHWERISLGAGCAMYRMTTGAGAQPPRISWKGVVAFIVGALLLVALGRV